MKLRALSLLVLLLLLLPLASQAWYPKTHAWLLAQAIELIKMIDREQMYQELYTAVFRMQLGRGAWREDFDPPVGDISRAMRHYYDPETPGPVKGIPYYDYFVAWPLFDKNEKTARPNGPRYDGAERWALDGGGAEANPFTWERAIAAYGHGSLKAREEAYFRLGHVVHLLADMSEVDHATNTVHPASGQYLIVNEEMLTDRVVKMLVLATRAMTDDTSSAAEAFVDRNSRDLIRKTIGDAMRNLGLNGPVQRTGLEGIAEDSIDPESVRDFFPTPESNGLNAKLKDLRPPSPGADETPGCRDFPAFFNELASFAKRERPAGMPLAVGCADMVPVLQSAMTAGYLATAALFGPGSQETQTVGQAWAAVTKKYLSSPIYAIPMIDELDPRSYDPYLRYRDAMFFETIPYLAGLMMHFQDVVREPPFVKDVTVEQPTGRKYWSSLGEGEKDLVNVRTFRTTEPFGDISTPDIYIPKSYKAVMGRTPAGGTVGALQSGKTAVVTIVFGPELDVSGEKIAPHIDPASVKVRIDGEPVPGRMKTGNSWTGAFTPELEAGRTEKIFKIEIEARDLDKHVLPMSPDGQGYWLDSDPKTVAQVVATPPDFDANDSNTKPPAYEWKFYDEGPQRDHVDRNHMFRVVREDVEEPARGPRISLVPDNTVVALSGPLDPAALEEERKHRGPELTAEYPLVQYVLMSDGTATIAPEKGKPFVVIWSFRPGQDGGWQETWTVQPEAGKGSVRRAAGPCQLSCVRNDWTGSGGAVQMRTNRTQPAKGEWTVTYDKDGAYVLHPGSGWSPPRFKLDRAAEPDTPNVLISRYLAWFEDGKREDFNHEALEAVERDLNARGLDPLTAVASLCAAKKKAFLRDSPVPGDKELSFRITSLALYHLGKEGAAHVNRGEYILQAIAQSKMNSWGDKTFIANWPAAALEKGVMAAPDFFPDTSGGGDYAGGITLIEVGRSQVAELKKKYKNYTRKIFFEGW
jgi:hypothetical protein